MRELTGAEINEMVDELLEFLQEQCEDSLPLAAAVLGLALGSVAEMGGLSTASKQGLLKTLLLEPEFNEQTKH